MAMAVASSLSRASSTSSVESLHDTDHFLRAPPIRLLDTAANPTPPRRTRKRFTNAQLTMLESLFHRNSHPSREEREAVAAAGGMEVKSVTIWFQNKRQTERKVALHNATTNGNDQSGPHTIVQTAPPHPPNHTHNNPPPNSASAVPRDVPPPSSSRRVTHHIPHSSPFPPPNIINTPPSTSRPSLDHVASRSEMRYSMTPGTPTRRHRDRHHGHHHSHTRINDDVNNYPTNNINSKHGSSSTGKGNPGPLAPSASSIWDHMPSSPIPPRGSPPPKDLAPHPKSSRTTKRTLEWACAAAARVIENSDDEDDADFENAHEDQRISRRHSPRPSEKRAPHQKQHHHHHQQQSQEQQRGPGGKAGLHRDSRNSRQQTSTRGPHAPDLDEVAGRASALGPAELTDDEDDTDEAITPPSTLGRDDARWSNPPSGKPMSLSSAPGRTISSIASSTISRPAKTSEPMSGSGKVASSDSHSEGVAIVGRKQPAADGNMDASLQEISRLIALGPYADMQHDEDVMRAALALCRLGRRK